jgi:polyhydroxybutyrate depolymerase
MHPVKRIHQQLRRHKVALIGLLFGVIVLQVTQGITGSGDFTFQQSSSATGESLNSVIELKGDRSTELILPKNYSTDVASPLLINLHGYSGNGPSQSAYTFLQEAAFNAGVAYVAPTGSEDSFGSTYWNATEACCDFNKSKVDDVAYIDSLIERSIKAANIDPARIYLFGHSNGHFMSYAYLCSGSSKVAAIAGLAGAMDPNLTLCKAKPNNILHIHGEKDGTILYEGGALFGKPYTSAATTVAQWQQINKCSAKEAASLDLLESIDDADTKVSNYDCKNGSLEFWSLPLAVHTPNLDLAFAEQVIAWLTRFQLSK